MHRLIKILKSLVALNLLILLNCSSKQLTSIKGNVILLPIQTNQNSVLIAKQAEDIVYNYFHEHPDIELISMKQTNSFLSRAEFSYQGDLSNQQSQELYNISQARFRFLIKILVNEQQNSTNGSFYPSKEKKVKIVINFLAKSNLNGDVLKSKTQSQILRYTHKDELEKNLQDASKENLQIILSELFKVK